MLVFDVHGHFMVTIAGTILAPCVFVVSKYMNIMSIIHNIISYSDILSNEV